MNVEVKNGGNPNPLVIGEIWMRADKVLGYDGTAPVVAAFSMPATANGLTISGISISATDNVGVVAYLLTTSATPPLASDIGWTAVTPTTSFATSTASYTATTNGAKTLYAWAKDAKDNVSAVFASASCILTTAPAALTAFATPGDTTISLSWVDAPDGTHSAATSYTLFSGPHGQALTSLGNFTSPHSITGLTNNSSYDFRVDSTNAAGTTTGVVITSAPSSASDVTAPVVTTFTVPATINSLTVPITTMSATDVVGVVAWMITESSTQPSSGAAEWNAVSSTTSFSTSSATYVATTPGAKTLRAWAKDAAGNISSAATGSVTISNVTLFSEPFTGANGTLPATMFSYKESVASLGSGSTIAIQSNALQCSVKYSGTGGGFTDLGVLTVSEFAYQSGMIVSGKVSMPNAAASAYGLGLIVTGETYTPGANGAPGANCIEVRAYRNSGAQKWAVYTMNNAGVSTQPKADTALGDTLASLWKIVLGDTSFHVYRSTDGGATFVDMGVISLPSGFTWGSKIRVGFVGYTGTTASFDTYTGDDLTVALP